MSVIIIGTGGGRATLRRIDAQYADPGSPLNGGFSAARAQQYNDILADLEKMADQDGCPDDPCPE